MSQRREFLVSTVAQMEALASPIRHQVHLAMEMLGPCSVNELAERMGRVPETLYYHVRRLEKVGILVKVGTRDAGTREEAIYQLKAKRLRVDPRQASPRFIKAMAKGCGALLRYAERTFVAALRKDATIRTGKASELRIRQVSVRLTQKSLIEVNARLDELQAVIDEADSSEETTMYAFTVCVAPIPSGEGV